MRERIAMKSILLACILAVPSLRAATHYVNIANPSPAPPYVTWATAATNIQDAVDVAASGDEVIVTNGVYAVGAQSGNGYSRVVVPNAITVRSVTGPSHTLIAGAPTPGGGHGPGAVRCVYLAAGAVLSGFTLTNGYTHDSDSGGISERGGGAWCASGAVLTNCVIVGNRAVGDGGGVYGGTLYRCVITGNSTQESRNRNGDGGGVDHCTLFNCEVTNNRGRKGGGADDSTLYVCVVIGNNGRVFGGGAARSRLYNCTVLDNNSRRGGGVSDCEVYNSIVYHNRAVIGPNYAALNVSTEEPAFYFSCTTPLPSRGSNNISGDPRMASWTHPSLLMSPCAGAGSPLYTSGLRDIHGRSFLNPPTIGVFEMNYGTFGDLSVNIHSDFTNLAVGFMARFTLAVDGVPSRTYWDFGDGTRVTNQLVVTHAWSSPGTYSVRLTASNHGTAPLGGRSTNIMVNVTPAPLFFVNRANPTPAYPYTSWATAATDIQTAIDVTNTAGRIVLVTNGVCDTGGVAVWGSMTNRVALTRGVFVRSVNGPRFTVLRGASGFDLPSSVGDGAIRCAYVGDGAILDGFTLTNGYTRRSGHISREQGGGGAWCESRGMVTNCVFVGNTSARDGGGASGGIFYHCTFAGNLAEEAGGGVDDAILYDCVVSNNIAHATGGGLSETEIHRSIVISNMVSFGFVAGAEESSLNRCVVAGNFSGIVSGAWGSDLVNCVIRGNGGNTLQLCDLVNCTVVGNTNTFGSAVSVCRIRNSIIYYNSTTDISPVSMDYSCAPTLVAGTGNITAAPLFADLASGDLRLLAGSPCIDAGVDLSAIVPTDFSGLPRPLDGNRDGVPRFDMGAHEFNPVHFISIVRSGNNVRLCWFDTLPGMELQKTVSLANPAWTTVPFSAAANCVDLPTPAGNEFYRLIKPMQ
jgi:PKD repeat protein